MANLLVHILSVWRVNAQPPWEHILMSTVFAVAYHGGLQVSEYAKCSKSDHTLQYENLHAVWSQGQLVAYQAKLPTYKFSGNKPYIIVFSAGRIILNLNRG